MKGASILQPMNYRHAFHAGNFADVMKHLALVSILLRLRRKEAPFAVIDTHAGRGLYDLSGEAAARTNEAANGIARLMVPAVMQSALPEVLHRYLAIVEGASARFYPGSPLIATMLLRRQDRLVAIEKHADEAAALKSALATFKNKALKSECADGYARLGALLPPPERRGLVLIDPPFEDADEFGAAARAVGAALKRFATGIYLLWFPVKSAAEANAFGGEVLAAGAKKVLRIDLDVGVTGSVAGVATDAKERLTGSGLIVVNPPFGFADDMRETLARVAPLLSDTARFEVRWLAGGE
jgi:23S rRNA (adenine2030-N6)-methyltransferase